MTNTYTKKTLGETLIQNIKENDKASIIAAYFTIYGFHELKKELSKIDNLKLILSSGLFTYEDRQFFTDLTTDINGDRYEYRFKNQLNIHKIAQECADWVKAKTEIKSTKIPGVIGTNLIHLKGEKSTGINISTSNLSASDLGFAPNDKITMNTVTHDPEVTQQMLSFFNQNWNNEALMSDVKKDVLEQLELAYKDNAPSSVYYFTLYNIFKDYLVDLDEENHQNQDRL